MATTIASASTQGVRIASTNGEARNLHTQGGAQFHWSDESDVRDEHLRHDLGSFSDYERATVLVSDDYRYFGADSPVPLGEAVWNFVHHIGRGHRVHNLSPDLERALNELCDDVWHYANPDPACPSQSPRRARSHRGGHCVVFPREA